MILRSVLSSLEGIHKFAIKKVDYTHPNKDFAIYILCGRAITLSYSAIAMLENGHLAEVGALVRLIEETVYLSDYFYDKPDGDKKLKKWLNNGVIAPKIPRKAQGSIFSRIFGRRDNVFDTAIGDLYHALSKYIHPTYGISKMNMKESDQTFDYQWLDYQNYDVPIFVSVSSAIVTVINGFLYCREIYEIDDTTYRDIAAKRDALYDLGT